MSTKNKKILHKQIKLRKRDFRSGSVSEGKREQRRKNKECRERMSIRNRNEESEIDGNKDRNNRKP